MCRSIPAVCRRTQRLLELLHRGRSGPVVGDHPAVVYEVHRRHVAHAQPTLNRRTGVHGELDHDGVFGVMRDDRGEAVRATRGDAGCPPPRTGGRCRDLGARQGPARTDRPEADCRTLAGFGEPLRTCRWRLITGEVTCASGGARFDGAINTASIRSACRRRSWSPRRDRRGARHRELERVSQALRDRLDVERIDQRATGRRSPLRMGRRRVSRPPAHRTRAPRVPPGPAARSGSARPARLHGEARRSPRHDRAGR